MRQRKCLSGTVLLGYTPGRHRSQLHIERSVVRGRLLGEEIECALVNGQIGKFCRFEPFSHPHHVWRQFGAVVLGVLHARAGYGRSPKSTVVVPSGTPRARGVRTASSCDGHRKTGYSTRARGTGAKRGATALKIGYSTRARGTEGPEQPRTAMVRVLPARAGYGTAQFAVFGLPPVCSPRARGTAHHHGARHAERPASPAQGITPAVSVDT